MTTQSRPVETSDLFAQLQRAGRRQSSLRHGLGIHPTLVKRLLERAAGLLSNGRLQEAEELLIDLSAVDNLAPHPPFMLGACRAVAGDLPGAVAAYTEALLRGRTAPPDFGQRVALCRAQALMQLDQLRWATQDLDAAATCQDTAVAERAAALQGQIRQRLEGREGSRP